MKKIIFALIVITTVCSSSVGWCTSKTYQLSVTMPASVLLSAQSLPNQTIQTQQTSTSLVTSIVTI